MTHGNTREKWKVTHNAQLKNFTFQKDSTSIYKNLPIVRDEKKDLALYLRRLGATDDSMPVTIRQDTYTNMAQEILDGTDRYIWIRKGKWDTTVLKIHEEIDSFVEDALKSGCSVLSLIDNKLSEKGIKEGNLKSFIELDAEFHEIITRASRSERLLELCQMLRRHMLRYRIDSLHLPDVALRAIKDHRRIFECIRRKDKRGVPAAIRDHLEWSKHSIKMCAFEEKQTQHMN